MSATVLVCGRVVDGASGELMRRPDHHRRPRAPGGGAPDRGAFELPVRKDATSEIESRRIEPGVKLLLLRSNR
jgi:hypothetical protein